MDDQLKQFQMIQKGMRLSCRPNPAEFVDLTLRLGLPNYNDQNNLTQNIGQYQQETRFNYFESSDTNRDLRQAMQYGYGNINNGNENIGGPINYLEKYNRTGVFMGQMSDNSSKGPAAESISTDPSYGVNPYKNAFSFSPVPEIKDYSGILNPSANTDSSDTTSTIAQKGEGGSSTSRRNKKRRVDLASENVDQDEKRCTNVSCGANSTPMWRKGPLGPKSLCNACGIKYRKQEERRAAMEGLE